MLDLLIGLFTAGGSAGFGSILKMGGGLIDSINRARETKAEAEFLREAREHENAIEFQKTLMGSDNFSKHTRRLVAIIGMSTLSILTLWSAFVPELELVTIPRGSEGRSISFLFGLATFPQSAETLKITLGHIAVVTGTVVFPMIVGFYFTPGGRR